MLKRDYPDLLGIRILVVDDDPFTRKIVRHVLTSLRFTHIEEAENAESALALLRGQNYDLLITDVQMPGVNGLELLRRIREGLTPAHRDIRAIVLTSFSNTEVLSVAMALEVNGFLVKPIKPDIVQQKIAQAMAERTQLRPALGYQSINTDLCTLQSQSKTENRPETGVQQVQAGGPEQAAGRAQRVSIQQLQPGMRLAQPVLTSDGTLLLSEGHTLSQLNINRLLDLHTVFTDEFVWIDDADSKATAP